MCFFGLLLLDTQIGSLQNSCAFYVKKFLLYQMDKHVLGLDLWETDFIMHNLTVPLTRKNIQIKVFKVF